MIQKQGKVRNGKNILIICLVFLSLITLCSAELGFSDSTKPKLVEPVQPNLVIDINESSLNVNYSDNSGLLDGTDWDEHFDGTPNQMCYFDSPTSVKGIPNSYYHEEGIINFSSNLVEALGFAIDVLGNRAGTQYLLAWFESEGYIVIGNPFNSKSAYLDTNTGNFRVYQNISAQCYTFQDGTVQCSKANYTSAMDYTNIAMQNQSNNFTKTQYFGNKTIIQNPLYLDNPIDSVYVYYEIGNFTTPLLVRNEEGIANSLSNTPVAYMEGYWPSFVIRDVDSLGNGLATGFSAEAGGQLLSFGTNYPQLGYNNPNYPGAYFRIDTRTGYESQLFQVATVATEYGGEGTVMTLSQSGELLLNNISTIGTSKIPSIWNTRIITLLEVGNITYNDTYFEDVVAPLTIAKVGATSPSFDENQRAYYFQDGVSEQYAFVSVQIPHSYKSGTNVSCHLHVRPDGTQKNNVTFELNMTWFNIWGVGTGATTTTYTVSQNFTSGVAYNNTIIDFPDLSGTGKTMSSTITAKVTRKSNAATDSYTGNVYVDFFDCHYEQDSPGSRTEYGK